MFLSQVHLNDCLYVSFLLGILILTKTKENYMVN